MRMISSEKLTTLRIQRRLNSQTVNIQTNNKIKALKYREEEGSVLMIMFQREAYFRVDIDNSLKDKSKYSKKKFLGHFQRRPVENGYHDIEVILKGDVLFWVTKIGSQWELEYDGKTLRKSDNTIYNEQVDKATLTSIKCF